MKSAVDSCQSPRKVKHQLNDKAKTGKLTQIMRRGMAWVESRLKRWTRPTRRNQLMRTVSDLRRSKGELIAENLSLRQQLIVLERQVSRPKLTQHDRQRWVDVFAYGSLLFDIETDPQQSTPLENPKIEEQMVGLLVSLMQANDAPPEQHIRLGLEVSPPQHIDGRE